MWCMAGWCHYFNKWWQWQQRRLPSDTGSQGYWYSSIKVQNATYSFQTLWWWKFVPTNWQVPSIYCIARTFFCFNRPRLVTQKYRVHVTEQVVCTWVKSKLTYWYISDILFHSIRVPSSPPPYFSSSLCRGNTSVHHPHFHGTPFQLFIYKLLSLKLLIPACIHCMM